MINIELNFLISIIKILYSYSIYRRDPTETLCFFFFCFTEKIK